MVYTPDGAVLYRSFDPKGDAKAHPLKPPKTVSHPALMRHFRDCILGKATPIIGARQWLGAESETVFSPDSGYTGLASVAACGPP